jgi:endonuclease/exonuclease/phosphatase family metal-dependent hydrolase
MVRWILIALLSMSFAHAKGKGQAQFRILTTNFENLFDATHDVGKEDYTFLPLAVKRAMPEAMAWCERQTGFYREECFNLDWTNDVLALKIKRIAAVLKASMAPSMPDVIVVQEVENLNVLKMVARALGPQYRAILLEGPDERGIDTGMITRLAVRSTKLHSFTTSTGRATRGILEAQVLVGRKVVTVLSNHWPSQSNPDADRMLAGELLLKVATDAEKRSDLVIAAGDFNTAEDDAQNALTSLVLPAFWDAEAEALALGVDLGAAATYSYKGVWASLDHIFIMKSSVRRKPDFSRVHIFTDEGRMIEHYTYQGRAESRPIRYNHEDGTGYSDHLPMGMVVKF